MFAQPPLIHLRVGFPFGHLLRKLLRIILLLLEGGRYGRARLSCTFHDSYYTAVGRTVKGCPCIRCNCRPSGDNCAVDGRRSPLQWYNNYVQDIKIRLMKMCRTNRVERHGGIGFVQDAPESFGKTFQGNSPMVLFDHGRFC